MSQNYRNLALAAALVAATGIAFGARPGTPVNYANPLRASLFADGSAHGVDGVVQLKLTNNSSQVLKIPYWQLPSDRMESNLFQVTINGRTAPYIGPLVKRGAPTEADMVVFQPYETRLVSVNLANFYDLSGGDASVRFNSILQDSQKGGRLSTLQTATLRIWLDGASLNTVRPATARPVVARPWSMASPSSVATAPAPVSPARRWLTRASIRKTPRVT